jgi:hypothetical protein
MLKFFYAKMPGKMTVALLGMTTLDDTTQIQTILFVSAP